MGGEIFHACQAGPGAHLAYCIMGTSSFSGVKEQPGRDADPSPPSSAVVKKEQSYTSIPPMGRTACTEPQCLYNGPLYLFLPTYKTDPLFTTFNFHETTDKEYV